MRFLLAALAVLGTAAAQTCNGHASLCARKYSNVTFVGSHNSAFDGFGPAHNQHISVRQQLNLGVRFLQAQTQLEDGGLRMCHTDCDILDEGSLDGFLDEVGEWMGAHESDVVTLLLTNIDGVHVGEFADAFERSGLDELVFTPEEKLALEDWPTLGELIDSGKRLIVFMGTPLYHQHDPLIYHPKQQN